MFFYYLINNLNKDEKNIKLTGDSAICINCFPLLWF